MVIYLLHKWSFKSFGSGFIASEITDIFISELAEDLTCHFRTAPGTAVKLNIIVRLGTLGLKMIHKVRRGIVSNQGAFNLTRRRNF